MRIPSWLTWGSDASTHSHSVQLDQSGPLWGVALVGLTSLGAEAQRESVSAFAGPLTTAGATSSAQGQADWARESHAPNDLFMPVSVHYVQQPASAAAIRNLPQMGPLDNSEAQGNALQAALLASMTGTPS